MSLLSSFYISVYSVYFDIIAKMSNINIFVFKLDILIFNSPLRPILYGGLSLLFFMITMDN
jgi:hypothetical protein